MRRVIWVLVAALVASAAGVGAQELLSPSRPAVAAVSGGATLLRTGSGIVWASVDDDIFRSTDGGAHWKAVLPPAAHPARCGCFYYSYFFGPQHAWVEESVNYANSFGDRLWSTADGGRRWEVGPRLPLPPLWQSLDLGGIGYTFDFTSASNGYLVASSSDLMSKLELLTAVWRTRDGGHSWKAVGGTRVPLNGTSVSANSNCQSVGFLAATFVDATTGWIANPCGQGPAMWETIDGGSTWRPSKLAIPPGGWERGVVPMAAPPVVTASGAVMDQITTGNGALVVEETQAGSSWRYLGRLRTRAIGPPATLNVIDATHFVLPASDGMWVSEDGAKTWHLVTSGIDLADLGPMSLVLDGSQQIAGIVLAESSDSGTDADAAAVALRTTDGGASWQPAGSTLSLDPYGGGAAYDLLDFSGAGTGYVAGDGGLAVTDDGGRIWRRELGEAEPIDELEVDGPADVVALGSDSLLTTSDGGRQWRLESEPAAGGLASVSFVDADVGFGAVCEPSEAYRDFAHGEENVELVRTADGGRSWQPVSLPPEFGCVTAISNGQGSGSPAQLCVASAQVLYAIAGPPDDRNGAMVPEGAFLFRSADAGTKAGSRVSEDQLFRLERAKQRAQRGAGYRPARALQDRELAKDVVSCHLAKRLIARGERLERGLRGPEIGSERVGVLRAGTPRAAEDLQPDPHLGRDARRKSPEARFDPYVGRGERKRASRVHTMQERPGCGGPGGGVVRARR